MTIQIPRGRRVLDAARGISLENPTTIYVHPTGVELLQMCNSTKRSDTFEWCFDRRSPDNGRTWSDPLVLMRAHEEGDVFTHYGLPSAFLDPETDILIGTINVEDQYKRSVFSTFANGRMLLRYSREDAQTWTPFKRLIQRGSEYDETHWAYGIEVGKNFGSNTTPRMIRYRDTILLPIFSQALDEHGAFFNPFNVLGFCDCQVLVGRWNGEMTDIDWSCEQRVRIDPEQSSRGLMEPVIAEIEGDRILMVMRGSNTKMTPSPDVKVSTWVQLRNPPQVARALGVKWYCLSDDGGQTWDAPRPLPYDDGSVMFSSSSYSALIRHSNGTLYWVGNIARDNPDGNWPRHPLNVAVIDEERVAVRKDSVRVVAERGPGEVENVQFSNFWVYEDRETRELVVVLGKFPELNYDDWTAHMYEYRVQP